jgi:hypothetical protein
MENAKSKEFCWRYNLKHAVNVCPARYSDGSVCVIVADDKCIQTLTVANYDLSNQSLATDVDSWLLSKGYTPIW